jgi:hypothetical protein
MLVSGLCYAHCSKFDNNDPKNGIVKKGEQSKIFWKLETSGSDILASAREICYTRISSNQRRYATQTPATRVHKMAVAPEQRLGRPSDWRQNRAVLAGWGAGSQHGTIANLELKSSENRHPWCITAKLKQSLAVLTFRWVLTTAVVPNVDSYLHCTLMASIFTNM